MADQPTPRLTLDIADPFAPSRPRAGAPALDVADPFAQPTTTLKRPSTADHSTIGDLGRRALGAAATGTGELVQAYGDIGKKVEQALPFTTTLHRAQGVTPEAVQKVGKSIEGYGARESANVSPEYAKETSVGLTAPGGLNLTNLADKAVTTVAGMAPAMAGTMAAGALGGPAGALAAGTTLFGLQGEAGGRNAGEQQVAALTDAQLQKIPAYQAYLKAGMTPAQARAKFGEDVANRQALVQGGFGAGLGLVGEVPGVNALSKAVASKLVRPLGARAAQAVGKGVAEGAGFAGINAAGQVAGNVTNPVPTPAMQGVGEAAASGLLPGFIMGGGRALLTRPQAGRAAPAAAAAEPNPGAPPGSLSDAANVLHRTAPPPAAEPAAAAPKAGTGEAVSARIPPPVVPWVNTETGEVTTPSDNQVLAALHSLRDQVDAQRAAGNKPQVSAPQTAAAWGIPTKRFSELRAQMQAERKSGVTTSDALARLQAEQAGTGPQSNVPTENPVDTMRAVGVAQDARLRAMQGQLDATGKTIADVRNRVDQLKTARATDGENQTAKQPWQMTRKEFEDDAAAHEAQKEGNSHVEQQQEPPPPEALNAPGGAGRAGDSEAEPAGRAAAAQGPDSEAPIDAYPAPDANGLVTTKTRSGETVRVQRADLEGPRQVIPTYTAKGERRPNKGVHRTNLDPTGEKRAAEAQQAAANPFFDVLTRKDGSAFADQKAAQREINRQGLQDSHVVVPANTLREGAGGFVGLNKRRRAAPADDTKAAPAAAPAQTQQVIEAAAAESAAHPENPKPEPTTAQHEAGNFKAGHIDLHGMDVTVQVPKGAMRRGRTAAGKEWERPASDHYGHIRGTESADGEPIDVYLGPHAQDPNAKVFVIDQVKPGTNGFDEHKAMIGYASGRDARKSYDANFPKGLKTFGGIREMSMDEFKDWVKTADTKQPASHPPAQQSAEQQVAGARASEYGSKNRLFTKDAADAAREVLRKKLGNLNSGLDPEVVQAGITLAGYHVEAGAHKFADYAKAMVAELGDAVKPYLRSWYEAVRHYPGHDSSQMSSPEEIQAQEGAAKAEPTRTFTPEEERRIQRRVARLQGGDSEAAAGVPAKPARKAKPSVDTLQEGDSVRITKGGLKGETGRLAGVSGPDLRNVIIRGGRKAGVHSIHVSALERAPAPAPESEGATGAEAAAPAAESAGPIGKGDAVTITRGRWKGRKGTVSGEILGAGGRLLQVAFPEGSKVKGARIHPMALERSAPEALESKPETAQTGAEETAHDTANPGRQAKVHQPLPDGQTPAAIREWAPDRGAEIPRAGDRQGDGQGLRAARAGADGTADETGHVGDRVGPALVPDRQNDVVARGGRGPSAHDFRASPADLKREGSWFDTAKRNVDLIDLARKIESENRPATPEEQAQLAKYTGFGAGEIRNALFPVPGRYVKERDPERLIWPDLVDGRWKALAERMAELPREWQQSVLQSTQYAHYTSANVVRSIWDALQRIGFSGGRILEPGSGIGNFAMLMPDGMRASSRFTGVEFDGPTALIARLLSPQQDMLHADFIKRNLPRDYFDIALGNPPFSRTRIVADPDYARYKFPLHDYFFAKSLDRVRPGGLLAFVTSRYTMDKQGDRARRYLAERADLLGAIRLPSTAFEANAGTSVVADVLFLRKRAEGEAPGGVRWTDAVGIETKDGPVVVNQYFADNPDMVLGQQRISGNQDDEGRRINSNGYGGEQYTVVSYDKTPEELDAKFAAAVEKLPVNAYTHLKQTPQQLRAETAKIDFDPKVKREGVVYAGNDGRLMRVEQGVGKPLDEAVRLTPKDHAWFKSYVGVRDLVNEARLAQISDGDWQGALKKLNKAYDKHVAEHGRILDYRTQVRKTTDEDGKEVETSFRVYKNQRLWREDYDSSVMRALERIDESGKISKGKFLLDRTVGKPVVREVKTIGDALAVSLDDTGALHLDDIAQRLNISRDEAIEALGDQIYKTPTGEWQLRDEYLSGDVVQKLADAELAARADPSLERNVEALRSVQPEKLGPSQISVKLGAAWVPTEYVNDFANEIGAGRVMFDPTTETWQVEGGNKRSERRAAAEYGTAARSPSELLEAALNSRVITIKKKADGPNGPQTVTDKDATTAAAEAMRKIRDKFKSWIWTDSSRASDLVDRYNTQFNNIAPRQFDGSHLTLPGVSLKFTLHPHVKRAIWRQVQTGDTYLAHAVGAGKTIEMIAGGMEQKRLGLIKKPMYVVPNHMLEQFSNEFMELYPLANIMVADDKAFSPDRRRAFVAAATLNAPDAVIITHSAFERIGVTEASVAPIRDRIISELEDALEDTDKNERVRRSQLEQQIEAVNQRFDRIIGAGGKDSTTKFEDIGADFLYVDEAHTYRKLDFSTAQQVKGIDPNGSKRALDMYVKTRFLEKQRPGRAMVFASGTPVTNTMGELYTIMRFFAQHELDKNGIATFDSWARQFGEAVAALEANAAGKYEVVTRFAKFDNVPELMSRVRQFMDVLTSEHLGALVKRPDLEGGKPNMVVVEPTKALKGYMKNVLQRRLDVSRKWRPSKNEPFNPDPVLAIISDGRFAALDPRFFGGTIEPGETSKLIEMAKRVAADYKATAANKYVDFEGKDEPVPGSAQVVFYNIGFGAQSGKNRGFDARREFTDLLVKGGVKRSEIAWFDDANTDAKKESIFKAVRGGSIRVLLGSAKKMGTGVNVQKRLMTLHYFDPPWYPSDVEQPHGRIIRHGNQNPKVRIDWYATKGTYDSTMWQMVGRKQRFIDQAFTGDKSLRTMEDLSEASLYEQAAAIASGDPRALQLAGLRQDVERFERLQAAHANEQINVAHELSRTEWHVQQTEKMIGVYRAALKAIGDGYVSTIDAKVGGAHYDKPGEFGQAVKDAFNAVAQKYAEKPTSEVQTIGTLNGHPIEMHPLLDFKERPTGAYRLLVQVGGYKVEVIDDYGLGEHVDATGLGRKFLNGLNGISTKLSREESDLRRYKDDAALLRKKKGAPFEYQQELAEKYGELKRLEEELRAEGEAEAAAGEAAPAYEREAQDQTEEPPPQGEAFSRPDGSAPGAAIEAGRPAVRRDQLERIVAATRKTWGPDQPRVVVVDRAEDLPAAAKRGTAYRTAEGYYDGKDVYLVASNLHSPRRVQEVLAHEAVGHYGIDRIMDANVKGGWSKYAADVDRLRRNPDLGSQQMRTTIAEVERRYPDADANTFAKELPAVMAEHGVRNGLLDRVVAAVRSYLRRIMPHLRLNEAEIRQLLVKSDRLLRSGDGQAPSRPATTAAAHLFGRKPDTFYSAMTESVARAQGAPRKGTAEQWRQWLDGAQRRGEFKGAEREWSGIDGWLAGQKGPVTRAEVADYIRQHQVRLDETVLSDTADETLPAGWHVEHVPGDAEPYQLLDENGEARGFGMTAEEAIFDAQDPDERLGPAKYGQHTLPGGKNYRELLLTLPLRPTSQELYDQHNAFLHAMHRKYGDGWRNKASAADLAEDQRLSHAAETAEGGRQNFQSDHFDQPNIVAHVRMNDRTGPDGEKILHVEEVQSDWHQMGRKYGYDSPDAVGLNATRVADAPFKKDWPLLAMKRVLRYAAEHGYDKVTWTTGDQQADRYDLSARVKYISAKKMHDGDYAITAQRRNGDPAPGFRNRRVPESKLAATLGKDLADKIIKGEGGTVDTRTGARTYSGVDLKVGGEGMRAFYDKMLPNEIGKYVKKWGAKVGEASIDASDHRPRLEGVLRNHGFDPRSVTADEIWNANSGRTPDWLSHGEMQDIADGRVAREFAARNTPVHSVDITPAMRESVMQGQPLFSKRADEHRVPMPDLARHPLARYPGLPPVDAEAPNFGMKARHVVPDDSPLLQSHAKDNSPDRVALRKRLIDERFAGLQPVPRDQEPVALVMGGGGGSGKSAVLKLLEEQGRIPPDAVRLDPDEFKTGNLKIGRAGLPEYAELTKRGDTRAAAATHAESERLYHDASARAIAGHYNVVLDRTMSNPAKAMAEIKALTDAGYVVHHVGVSVPVHEALARSRSRFEEEPESRFVPPPDLIKAHANYSKGGFDAAAAAAHDAELYDNFVAKGESPILMARREAGKNMEIPDPERYNLFREKANVNRTATRFQDLYRTGPADQRVGAELVEGDQRGTGEGHAPGVGQGAAGSGRGLPPDRASASAPRRSLNDQAAPSDPSREPHRTVKDIESTLRQGDPGGARERARNWLRGKFEDFRPALLGAIQTRHLLELMEDSAPLKGSGKLYARSMQQMDADRQQLMAGAPDAADHPHDMLKKGAVTIAQELREFAYGRGLRALRGRVRPAAQRLFDLMHAATIHRLDPDKPYERLGIENARGDVTPWTHEGIKARLKLLRELALERGGDPWAEREKIRDEIRYLRNLPKMERARERTWPRLQAEWQALPDEAKSLYRQVRDWYSQYRDETETALIRNIEALDVPETYRRSLVQRMRLRFEEARREGVYFPLNRDGDFWIAFRDREGNEGFKMFESAREFERGEKRLRAAGFQIEAKGRRDHNMKAKDAPPGTFVRQVIDILQHAKVSEHVQDEIYQTFLRSLPELSMRKHALHRKNIAGYSEDALRAFAKNGYHGAHQLARLRHAQDMQFALEAMRTSVDNWRRGENATDARQEPAALEVAKADALVGEMQKRHEWIMHPSDQRLANMVNSLGFVYYLGASPASALTNLTQVAQTVLPVLGAEHGWPKAMRVLGAAWRDAARTFGHLDKTLTDADERRAFMVMQQRGDFSKTQSHTLAGLAEGNVLQTSPAWSRTMNAISWLFHTAEVINREAAGMAAYRLARASGKSFDEAMQYAGDVNAGANFDYAAANRPRYMQGNVQRIALQFKNYSVSMTWLFYRNLYQAMKAESPEVRRVARRTVTGILGMTAILAGTTGLPVYNTVKMAANAANTLWGDENEPWDFDDAFHRWLADNLGPDAARLIAEGPTNYLTGANLASRTSMANLWIHDDDQRLEGADAYHALLENLAGPIGGIVNNWYVGAEDVRRGHLERGVERMLPTAVKNSIKSLRYAHEGVNSLRGDPIVPDVSGWQDFLQAIGFQPAKVADQYRVNTAMKNYTSEIQDQRMNLMNAYALALRGGDPGDRAAAMRAIARFNGAHPEVAITGRTLASSLRQRARLSAQARNGVILNRRLALEAAQYAGAVQ